MDSFIEVALGTVPMLGKTLKGLSYAGKREIVRNMFREAEKDLGKSGAKKFFLGMAKNGAEEGAEEGLQYVNSWMWRALGGDQSNEFKLDELADNMAQGAIGGAALGIIGGADSARNARRALETEKTEQQTNPPETPVAVTTRFGEIPLGADGKPFCSRSMPILRPSLTNISKIAAAGGALRKRNPEKNHRYVRTVDSDDRG